MEINELQQEYMRLVFRAKDYADVCDDVNYMIADAAAGDIWALILAETTTDKAAQNPEFYT